ncbi:response regulator transcription factor [Solidesulfovibrio fructosivorans]|uniref:response regulator transcription factor n=1 Tax=Solidesulfovibrio fructosivorans TaxID=878 RepID=UPI0009D6F84C|nr:response regulator [Solidesulfovibrio fructosivorans]
MSPPESPTPVGARQLKILLVDDASPVRNMIKYMLAKEGFYDITEASNGKEALEILKNQKVDLVIADLLMPQISGLELLEKAKEIDSANNIKFIMISGSDSKENIVKAIQLGASYYLLKPISAKVLLRKVITIYLEKS